MRAALVSASLGLATAMSASAMAAPTAVKLSWASADASTTMAVSWVTATNVPTTIEYGVASTSEHMLTGVAPSEIVGVGWYHEIELTNLTPNTRYRYRVGSAGDWSAQYGFKTAPNDQCAPFSFVQLGDARSQDSRGPSLNWSSIHQEAMAAGAEFILNAGDLVREGTEIAQWAQWLADSSMVNPLVPMMPALGNHDDGPGDGNSANYNRLFTLPTNTVTGTEDYYAFVYNNLLVFSLSTQTFEDWQVQADWLRAIAAQHPNKWKVVYFHHPVYTTATAVLGIAVGHPPNEKDQNAFYAPAFDDAGIDIVFQSHNHIYERFRPLRYDPANPDEGREVANYGNGPGGGRLYVVSGGSGAFLDPLIEGNFQDLAVGSESRSKDHHFMRITIAGNTLQYAAVRTNAGNSSGGGTLIDSVTLNRPGADPCLMPNDPDADGDGYPASRDCDDTNPARNPGATELCGNMIDEDCDNIDPKCPMPPADVDGDGSPEGTDCDDTDPNRYPEHPEVECDGVDNDCDCLELCSSVTTDVCNPAPADGGVVPSPDATVTPNPDASVNPDATVVAADAGVEEPTPIATNECGCTHARPAGSVPFGFALVFAAVLARRKRR